MREKVHRRRRPLVSNGVANLLVSWISLLVSIGAVGAAIWVTRRNGVSLLKANSLRVTTEVFQQVRSVEFGDHLAKVFAGIGEEPSEEGGIDHLSGKYRGSVYAVCYFFDYLGVLLAFGMIEKDVILSALGTHTMRACGGWDCPGSTCPRSVARARRRTADP
ncbi:hypothetical protein [Amycolatopsis balhimycina]|uniref:hypothetical protein n=1 Tax=Amycolatopsis balhimycina TaxID=208443 RepID=UPI00146ACBA4|nr:hypothetical protein [Amycolatopsis balhimycina]